MAFLWHLVTVRAKLWASGSTRDRLINNDDCIFVKTLYTRTNGELSTITPTKSFNLLVNVNCVERWSFLCSPRRIFGKTVNSLIAPAYLGGI